MLGPEAFVLRYFSKGPDCRLVLVNLGRDLYPTPNSEPLLAPPPGMDGRCSGSASTRVTAGRASHRSRPTSPGACPAIAPWSWPRAR